MKKTLLVSAIALGLSSVALAGGLGEVPPAAPAAVAPIADFTPGIYVGIQGGYADSGMSAVDKDNGFHYDIDVKHHDIDFHKAGLWQITDVSKTTGLAGRIFVGYDFHKYFAIEAGYLLMQPKAEIKGFGGNAELNDHHDVNSMPKVDLWGFNFKDEVRTQAFDLVGKIKAPINENFGLYAKAGVGYLMQRHSYQEKGKHFSAPFPYLDQSSTKPKEYNYNETTNSNKFDLVYGFGAYYTVNNWTIDLSYTRYNSGKTKIADSKWQSNVDFYALGVSYKFNLPA